MAARQRPARAGSTTSARRSPGRLAGGLLLAAFGRARPKAFESHGLASDLVFFNNTNDVINAFLRGDAEVAAIGSGGVFALEAASPGRVRFIYGQENKSYSLIVPAGSQVAKIEDLRGKRIVTWPSPTPKAFLKLILDPRIGKQGYSLTQVDQHFLLQALAHGDVDALFIQDIYAWQAVNSGKGRFLSVLPLEEYVAKPFFNGGGVIQSKTASIDPGLARSIREVLDDSVRFIREHEPEARLARAASGGVAGCRSTCGDRSIRDGRRNRLARAQKVADLMREQGMFDSRVNAKGMLP